MYGFGVNKLGSIISQTRPTFSLDFASEPALDPRVDFTRASTGTYLDSDGLLKTASVNTPRIEYDADGNLLGLLVEEQRTNLLTYSEDFTNAVWAKQNGATIVSSSELAPDGTYTATRVAGTAALNSHLVELDIASSGQTKSIWARTVSGTGTTALLATAASNDKIVTLTENWQRFDIAYDDETGAFPQHFYAVDFRAGTLEEVIVWGAQLEAGSFPTSYIPTSGSTATRSADVASLSTSAFGYNQSAGTVVVEASGLSPITGQYVFDIHDNTSSEQIYLRLDSTSIGRGVVIDGGSVVFNADATGSTPNANTFVKYGYAASNNDFAITANGSTPTVDNLGTMPTVTKLTIGGREVSAGYLNGHIKSLKYYPRRLTNAQLQALTS